jgi:hypothetical protein
MPENQAEQPYVSNVLQNKLLHYSISIMIFGFPWIL